MEKITILGVSFDNTTFNAAVDTICRFAQGHKPKTVFTPNPEMVMAARKNPDFLRVLNGGDLVVPDGIGIVYASKLQKNKLRERVAGYDVTRALLDFAAKNNKTAFFLGGAKGVAQQAVEKCTNDFPGLVVVGVHDGFFKEGKPVLDIIKSANPDILLVGLGFPKQELWIDKYKQETGAAVLIGCGGTIDALAGTVKRAPRLFIRLGLEWFYRLLKQPSRFRRQLAIPRFIVLVIMEKLHGKNKQEDKRSK